jgi:carboxyl-terminal processing protease
MRLLTATALTALLAWPLGLPAQDLNPPASVSAPAPKPALSPEDARADQEWQTALSLVESRFIKPMDRQQIVERALILLLKDLDPYSRYLTPQQLADFDANLSSQYAGVGITLGFDEKVGLPRVEQLMAGAPAVAAGMQRGDYLAKIDGRALDGLNYEQVSGFLRGKPGTAVEVQVQRGPTRQLVTLPITRALIRTPSVRGARRDSEGRPDYRVAPGSDIGYVRISSLARDTVPQLEEALEQLKGQHARALVLDLRDCTGGLMNAALGSADMFVDKGKLLTVVQRGEDTVYQATRGTRWRKPVVVLINDQTVSSGEILAGALKDSAGARLVGQRSFGKGRIQVLYHLGEGMGGMMISTGTFQRPNGQTVDMHDLPKNSPDAGIRPDAGLEVAVPEAELKAWREFNQFLDGPFLLTPEEQVAPVPDRVLDKALQVLGRRG